MPNAVRLGDICTGHGCHPGRPNVQASDDVYINGRGAHRRGDMWAIHCCGSDCHGSILDNGSPTVFVNGKRLGRVTDPVECGSLCATGSPNVFADDRDDRDVL